jgi:predicted nucleic acid-binding protein
VRIVLDASVAVAAARRREPAHARSRLRVTRILRGLDDFVVPALFPVEVGAALARAGAELAAVRAYVESLVGAADRIVPLGSRAARHARETAMRWHLRAADAIYVSLAVREGLPLCTLDQEVLDRAGGACRVIRP